MNADFGLRSGRCVRLKDCVTIANGEPSHGVLNPKPELKIRRFHRLRRLTEGKDRYLLLIFRCRASVRGFAPNVLNLCNLRNLQIFYLFGVWVKARTKSVQFLQRVAWHLCLLTSEIIARLVSWRNAHLGSTMSRRNVEQLRR